MIRRVLLLIVALLACWLAGEQQHPPREEQHPPHARLAVWPLEVIGGDVPQPVETPRDEPPPIEEPPAAPRAAAPQRVAPAGCEQMAAEWGLPVSVLWRESRCDEHAYNSTGCGGRGCVGAAQLDLGHFWERSPWGGVGGCSDLDAESIEDQRECAWRLSNGGTNLRPWGG